jgi:hypothetical protein
MLVTFLGATFAFPLTLLVAFPLTLLVEFPLTLLVEYTTVTSLLLISQFWFHLHDKKRIGASTNMNIINALS